jgi:hypothetical protein
VRRAGPILLLLALAGCTAWPPPAGGGAAERFPLPDLAADEDPELRRRLQCGNARLAELADRAELLGRFAGQVAVARLVAARAMREYVGGLPGDAALSLDSLDAALARLNEAMGGAARPAECP